MAKAKTAKKKSPPKKPRASLDIPNVRAEQYEARKARERDRQAEQSRAGNDIAPIPSCRDPKKVARYAKDFKGFCEGPLKGWFTLEWSDDHLRAIAKIEKAVLKGDVFALAMPRGSGKTTLIMAALLWAILHGYRRYIVLIASDKEAAVDLLEGLKVELETNDELFELYPEACYPIRCLEGKPNKCKGQTLSGDRTYIVWKGPKIVFATVPNAKCSGAVIETFGILGRIRGSQYTLPTGEKIRPDLFMLDDPQTDASAVSETQVRRRLNVVNGTVMGLAGPGQQMSGFACVTVIQEGDLADQLLDRDKYPDWSGERFRLIYKWPTDERAVDLWDKYGTIRAEGLKSDLGIGEATEFYRKHQKDMDRGAQVAWAARYAEDLGEISALQHAYNLRFRTPETFDAEYQNDPKPPESDVETLSVQEIERKLSGYKRAVLPPAADLVTAFVDVQARALYYLILATESSTFSSYVLQYGTWPEQTAKHYTLRNISKTLAQKYPRRGLEGRLRAGLFDLVDYLTELRFATPDGLTARCEIIGIDSAWGPSTKVVQAVALEHPRASYLLPTFGRGIKPGENPMSEWKPKPGERKGSNWILRPTQGGGRHLIVDTNASKSFANSRLNVALGDPGCLSLYTPKLKTEHRMISEHLRAEKVETVSINGGRSGEVWKLPPAKPDNHFWDCLVNALVMASIRGASVPDTAIVNTAKRRSKSRRRRRKLIV